MRELVAYFLRLGTTGFGGPVALVGLMERDLVTGRGWLTREEMREAIAISQSLPGPLAIQVGIFISYLRCGFWGAWAGGWAFILPNFLIVAALGALYVHFGGLSWMTGIFYGVSPAVIALILHSCWRLAKLGMDDKFPVADRGSSVRHHCGSGSRSGAAVHRRRHRRDFVYGSLFRSAPPEALAALAAPVSIGTTQAATGGTLAKLLVFFLKAGSLTFGSGLVIVPFLEKGLVQEMGWIDPHQFLVAVAIGMLSPGPVVITATFVGYLVAGFWGSLVSTIGIFLPSFLLILIAAPILRRHRDNANVQGFIKGAYAAAIGTILGACILLGRIGGDWLTVLIAAGSLAVLFKFKVSNPALVGVNAVVGLIAFPILQPAWVFVR